MDPLGDWVSTEGGRGRGTERGIGVRQWERRVKKRERDKR